MGCDIHAYLEYRHLLASVGWVSFSGEIHLARDYRMFGRLAGIRGGGPAVVLPRGLPKDLSYQVRDDLYLYISSDGQREREVTEKLAAKYVAKHGQHYLAPGYEPMTAGAAPAFVSDPDGHTYSWLTSDEYATAIGSTENVEYIALLAAMRSFESNGIQTRVVFWFDN